MQSHRQLRVDIARFLVEEGLAELKPGYGHATGEQIADALLRRYHVQRAMRDLPLPGDELPGPRHYGRLGVTGQVREQVREQIIDSETLGMALAGSTRDVDDAGRQLAAAIEKLSAALQPISPTPPVARASY